jgi:hypothetical protein
MTDVHTHGAEQNPPWKGHKGTFGIEDGCRGVHSGHRASLEPSILREMGTATVITLDRKGVVKIRHLTGVVARTDGWNQIINLSLHDSELHLKKSGQRPSLSAIQHDIFLIEALAMKLCPRDSLAYGNVRF